MTTPTCPYCNALLAGNPDTCPVCGERLGGASPPTGVRPGRSQPPVRQRPAPTAPPGPGPAGANRRTAVLIVAGMLGCAVLALGYALWTQADRRANDQGPGPRPPRSPFEPLEPGPTGPVPPDRLAALRALPAGLDLLVGVHFAALYDDPATRPLLDQPLPVGQGTVRLADLRTWVGLEPETIDHAVLGLGLPRGALLPRVVLVVRTRRPYDDGAVKRALRATEDATTGAVEKKKLWNVHLGGLNLPASLWLADDRRTLVFGLTAANLAGLPVPEPDRLGHLPERLRELLRRRLDAGVAVWSVGSFRGGLGTAVGPALPSVLEGLRLTPEQRQAVAGLQSLAAGVVPGEEIACRLYLELENTSGARQVAAYLGGPGVRPPLQVVQEEAEVLLQWKTTAQELARLLPR